MKTEVVANTTNQIFFYKPVSKNQRKNWIPKLWWFLVGRTIEEYIDDIMVKTRCSKGLIYDLRETFDMHKANDIKLNPKKCVFGVQGGMLLGFLVSK